jgi:hypothetical protein
MFLPPFWAVFYGLLEGENTPFLSWTDKMAKRRHRKIAPTCKKNAQKWHFCAYVYFPDLGWKLPQYSLSENSYLNSANMGFPVIFSGEKTEVLTMNYSPEATKQLKLF